MGLTFGYEFRIMVMKTEQAHESHNDFSPIPRPGSLHRAP